MADSWRIHGGIGLQKLITVLDMRNGQGGSIAAVTYEAKKKS
jgi:hypothetical protein